MNRFNAVIKGSPLDRDSLMVEFREYEHVSHVWYYTKDVGIVMWNHLKLWIDTGFKPTGM